MTDDQVYTLALTKIPGLGNIGANSLIRSLGSAQAVFENRDSLPAIVKGVSAKLVDALGSKEAVNIALKEMEYADKNGISCITIGDMRYPSRMRECDDAPLALFYRGTADLNSLHIISVVGTRNITSYGEDICSHFISELSEMVPDVVIVSGLAYGTDILAHRCALKNGLSTIGVLAHGLDRIYPSAHRRSAVEMLENGGLLTEFMSGTNPDRQNFIKRNRIVAGMSDGVAVIQSAVKGGALITADIADSYGRDCFAFPGSVYDEYSKGCNELIRHNRAMLITSAHDLVEQLGWQAKERKSQIQRELFPVLSDDEKRIVEILSSSLEGIQINRMVVELNIPINKLSALLLELEMKGVIRSLAGGMYRIIH